MLCFDGDAAGARAARRAAELALPMLTPERTLRVLSLPAGEDPDSLVRHGGPGRFADALGAARGLSDALYGLLGEGTARTTPEQRAAFRTALIEAAGTHPGQIPWRRIPRRPARPVFR